MTKSQKNYMNEKTKRYKITGTKYIFKPLNFEGQTLTFTCDQHLIMQ